MAEQPIEDPRVVRQWMRLQVLRGGGVERLRILDRVELLALVVLRRVAGRGELLPQVIGERAGSDALGKEAIEVRLVLGVLGRGLEALRLAIGSARRAALVAHLVDLAPALRALRFVVVVRHSRMIALCDCEVLRPTECGLLPNLPRCQPSVPFGSVDRLSPAAVKKDAP